MNKVKGGASCAARHKKLIRNHASGTIGRTNCFKIAVQRVHRAWLNAYIGRKVRKRQMRSLWIQRIGAASRMHGMSYSKFMYGLKLENIEINRKMLAHLAALHKDEFALFAQKALNALEVKSASV